MVVPGAHSFGKSQHERRGEKLMLNIKAEELERIIRTVTEAIRMHDHWRDNLMRSLVCKLRPDDSFMAEDTHQHCAFGRWFYSNANERLRLMPMFEEIGTLHRLMHIGARDISRKFIENNGKISVKEYDALHERMVQFRTALVNLKSRTARTLQSMDRFEATHDQLTNLPNRVDFQRRLQKCIDVAQQGEASLAVLFIDLDNFKPINDTHGHHVGDVLLQDVARRLLGCIRDIDAASRLGGDEFAVILQHIPREEIEVICLRIIDRLSAPFNCEGKELSVTASIGIALYPEHGNDECTLLKMADKAMYRAKEKGKNQFDYVGANDPASSSQSQQASDLASDVSQES